MLTFVVSEDINWLSLVDYSEDFERKQIEISLTKKIHNHFFHPLVKKKHWDGSICFVDKKLPVWRVPIGLWSEVYQICEKYKIELNIEGLERLIDSGFTLESYTDWCNEFFKDGVGGDPNKMPRDYQIETAWKIIKFKLSVSEVATSSGKTLIAFMVMAYLKEVMKVKKFLMIVPNTNLVIQGSEDFEEYGLQKLEDCEIQQIHGANKKKISGGLMIGTYQSLVKMDPEFFEDVEAVFVDECLHPDSLITIYDGSLKKISDVKIGEMVLTVNNKTGDMESKPVDFVYHNMSKDNQMYEIETECGKILKVTGNHKLRLSNGEWKGVEDLKDSDELWDI
jgi:hypothetical protein